MRKSLVAAAALILGLASAAVTTNTIVVRNYWGYHC
jgi:hypothetical protein